MLDIVFFGGKWYIQSGGDGHVCKTGEISRTSGVLVILVVIGVIITVLDRLPFVGPVLMKFLGGINAAAH